MATPMEIQTMAKLSKTLEANLRFDDNALETVANLTVTLRLLNMSDRAIDSGEHFKTIKEVLVSAMGLTVVVDKVMTKDMAQCMTPSPISGIVLIASTPRKMFWNITFQ